MKDQNNQGPKGLSVIFLSWFYTGRFPKAPGTMGSLATVPLILLLHYLEFNIYSLFALTFVIYVAAVLVTQRIQNLHGLHDPQWIVIDEVIGMLITWGFVMKIDPLSLFQVFIVFRFFDIVKIWPASYFDRLHHGVGTITDDVISGLYAGITILLFQKFF
ncbi:MAG TPA: phosphatidylglycerophosphatase A [Bacteriovoracaceae bacterium]|nr:phosphatidylglycerophosphatase A [Bacteriovoracaceae bacterium]